MGLVKFSHETKDCIQNIEFLQLLSNHIYQPLRSGRIWHKVNF